MTLRPLVGKQPEQNCITDLIAADSARTDYHHATQLLRVTLCKRGECVPTPDNTVLFGLIQWAVFAATRSAELTDVRFSVKYSPEPYTFYERRAVTWSPSFRPRT